MLNYDMPITTAPTPPAQLRDLLHHLTNRPRHPEAAWQRHWLIAPGQGRAQWLQQQWAHHSGIASRSQTLSIRSLVELAAHGDPNDPRPTFRREALIPAIAGVLPHLRPHLTGNLSSNLDKKSLSAMAAKTASPEHDQASDQAPSEAIVDSGHLAWAEALAAALDDGLLSRDEPCANNELLTELSQHPHVAPHLQGHLGMQFPENFIQHAQAWVGHWQARPGGMPCCYILLDGGLPHILMQRLHLLLHVIPAECLHLSLLEPTNGYWGDLRTGRRRWDDSDDAGPLLRPFGRRLQDLHNQIIDYEWPVGGGADPGTSSSQHQPLDEQHDQPKNALAFLHRLTDVSQPPQAIEFTADDGENSTNDGSFGVYGCPSPLREIEVVRDRILATLHKDPSYQPEDILILLADPETYAPLLAAGLQPQADRHLHVPFRATGFGSPTIQHIRAALTCYQEAFFGRFTQESFAACLEHPLISKAFRLTELVEASTIMTWLDEAQFRWGIDAAHRREQHHNNDDRWSLQFALKRLAMGAIAPMHEQAEPIGDVIPLERASGIASTTLASLAHFLIFLQEIRQRCQKPQSLDHWCQVMARVLEQGLAEGTASQAEQRARLLHHTIDDVRQSAPPEVLFDGPAFFKLFDQAIAEPEQPLGAGGGVPVAPLATWAGTPARSVFILGLNNGSFPRREQRPDWHPLSAASNRPRQLGDPGGRDDDRHALLLSLLACREQFVMTYQQTSERDPRPLPPAPPVSDLLHALTQQTTAQSTSRSDAGVTAVHHHQRLHGFSPSSLLQALPERSWLQHDYQRGAALAQRKPQKNNQTYGSPAAEPRSEAAVGAQPGQPASMLSGAWSLAPVAVTFPDGNPIRLQAAYQVFFNPCRLFCRQVQLSPHFSAHTHRNHDLLTFDGLERYTYRQHLLRAHLASKHQPEVTEHIWPKIQQRWCRSGDLPPGWLGERSWHDLLNGLPTLTAGDWEWSQAVALHDLAESVDDDDHQCTWQPDLDIECLVLENTLHVFGQKPAFGGSRNKPALWFKDHRQAVRVCLAVTWAIAAGAPIDAVNFHASEDSKGNQQQLVQPVLANWPHSVAEAKERLAALLPLWHMAHSAPVALGKDILSHLWPPNDLPPDLSDWQERWPAAQAAFEEGSSSYESNASGDDDFLRLCFRGHQAPFAWLGPDDEALLEACLGPDLVSAPLSMRFAAALARWLNLYHPAHPSHVAVS
jgi:exonuclease V gamma subunit